MAARGWVLLLLPAALAAVGSRPSPPRSAGSPPLPPLSRRNALLATTTALSLQATPAQAEQSSAAPPADLTPPPTDPSPLLAEWTATDGFSDRSFITFDPSAYKAMVDDASRTPLFEEAIKRRLRGREGELVVVDIGTGPFALLALIAARAGAKKVYAIEAVPKAADLARKAVKAARDVPAGVVTVIEGFSTELTLPEQADLVVAEVMGSIASEESLHATMRDAQMRHVKQPYSASSFIPVRCQTYAAPASYALHYVLGPPEFDWTKLKEPLRLNCRDETAQLIAEPQLLEEIAFETALPPPGKLQPAKPLVFSVAADRLTANERVYLDELRREGAADNEAVPLAKSVATSVSGLACWPALVLDPEGELIVRSRGSHGEPQKSHWQTVLPLFCARPLPVHEGDQLVIMPTVELPERVDSPLRYKLQGELRRAK